MTDSRPTDTDAATAVMLQELLRRTHLSAPDDLATAVAEEGRRIGARDVVVYLVDFEQKTLVPVPSPDASGREPLSVHGTIAGRTFISTSMVDVEIPEGRRLWIPLLDGTERLGVMEMRFDGPSSRLPEATMAVAERYAHAVAMLVVTKAAYSDHFTLLRRRQPMTMASELLWELLPPLVFATDDLVVAGLMEPAYDMGGDALDYALNGDVLHVAVFDAMGHGLPAAGMSAFALSAYRHSRRLGHGLAETYLAIDAVAASQQATTRFVTAVIAELDVASGRLRWISAGHPAPLLMRGGRIVKTLGVPPSPPMGLQLGGEGPVVGEESLESGDLLLLYTDGLTEARRPGGELFSVERLGEFIERQAAAGLPAPETLRRLREAIIERREGALRDDATAVLVEWRRGSERALVPQTV